MQDVSRKGGSPLAFISAVLSMNPATDGQKPSDKLWSLVCKAHWG